MKVYVSPSATRKSGYASRYFPHLKQELASYFEVLEADNRPCLMQSGALFRASLRADAAVLSFVENIAFHKLALLQTCLALLSLDIMHLRGCRIIFIMHNPSPHQGGNCLSKMLLRKLLRRADYVVAHTENTAAIVREAVGESKLLVLPHPTEAPVAAAPTGQSDVLIWGTVLPYKGVAEFLSEPAVRDSGLRIKVVGDCPNTELAARVEAFSTGSISFEQRRPEMEEVASLVAGSRFVVFPYLPGTISGSGTLVDTLRFGGSPVGPDVGAFRELAERGLCKVYRSAAELLDILKSDWQPDRAAVEQYLSANSWPAFVRTLAQHLKENA